LGQRETRSRSLLRNNYAKGRASDQSRALNESFMDIARL
jgi:hypothetical protein